MSGARHLLEAILKGRFSALLFSLALLFLFGPLIPGHRGIADKIFGIFILVVLASCLRAISRTRRFFIFMVIFTLINLGMGSVELWSNSESHAFQVTALAVRMLYFMVVFFSIMQYVLGDGAVTGDKICGAVSAYMIMGIFWSFIYSLFFLFDPKCIEVPVEWIASDSHNSGWTLYFSFTTLTTLGYGDLVPKTPAVQSYAILEAACGQLFLAVIIARLIALHITHERIT